MPDSRLREVAFVPGLRAILHDADTVELRTGVWNASSVMLADDERRGVLGKVILGLLNHHPLEAIARDSGLKLDDVIDVVEALAERQVLVSQEDSEKWNRISHLVLPTLGVLRDDQTPPQEAILLAPPHMAAFFRAAAGAAVSDRLRDAEDSHLTALSHRDLFLETTGLTATDAMAPYEPWRGKLIVVALPELHPLVAANVNRLAHGIGFSFVMAAVDGPFAIVGPAVIPGITPCFACAEARVLEALRDHTLYVQYRSALANGHVHGGAYSAIDPLQATTLSLLAWEVVNLLTVGSGFTSGKVLSVYAPTLEIVFHELLRMPGCPVCSSRSALDRPLYADLRSYLTTQLARGEGA
jgi:bacteriocin biosynthesis cyclodehydratase domain-containing protein